MVRIKERYLLVNIVYLPDSRRAKDSSLPDFVLQHQPTVEKLSPGALLKAIKAEVATLFGDYGSGALEGQLLVKYFSLATSTFILRCPRAHCQLLWSALTFMNRVPVPDGRPCIFRVVRVSGTIRKAEEEAIRQAKKLVLAAKDKGASTRASYALAPSQQDDDAIAHVTPEPGDEVMVVDDDHDDS